MLYLWLNYPERTKTVFVLVDPKIKEFVLGDPVLGDPKRTNNRPERLIANSVGGGGLWVCNLNGNIENGDIIQSSELTGRGEKQDDDSLHNYTVATATMDCSFKLDSSYYRCHEIGNVVRVAFIAKRVAFKGIKKRYWKLGVRNI